MVKTHVLTDRTFRYGKRINSAFKREIEKKNNDYSSLSMIFKNQINKNEQMKNSYNFLYSNYCKLYDQYLRSDGQNSYLDNAYDNLCVKYKDISDKYEYIRDRFDDLKERYNLLLNELHEEEGQIPSSVSSDSPHDVQTPEVTNNDHGHSAHVQ
jgi:hypothetical protein